MCRYRQNSGVNFSLLIVIACIGCGADLISKQWVWRALGPPEPGKIHWLWPEYVGLETSINTGALFGMGQGQVGLLAIVSVIAALALLAWATFGGASRDRYLCVTLGLILGGILGNLYDRLGLWGFPGVRDWILLQYGNFVWPNFNIADSLLVCGAGLILWQAFRTGDDGSSAVTSDTSKASLKAASHAP